MRLWSLADCAFGYIWMICRWSRWMDSFAVTGWLWWIDWLIWFDVIWLIDWLIDWMILADCTRIQAVIRWFWDLFGKVTKLEHMHFCKQGHGSSMQRKGPNHFPYRTFCYRVSSSLSTRAIFSQMRSKGSHFTLGVWGSGGWGCVRSTLRLCSQPFATVRVRAAWPCLWQVLQKGSLLEVAHVALLRFAWQAWHFVTFRRVL